MNMSYCRFANTLIEVLLPKNRKPRCKETVWPTSLGGYHSRECGWSDWKDGFCKQHHSDTTKTREEAASKRYEENRERNPYVLLEKANERLNGLVVAAENLRERYPDYRGNPNKEDRKAWTELDVAIREAKKPL